MNRIDRLLGVLVLLQTKKHITADCIAEKYAISLRTVYRDIKALCELGVPIGCEQFKGYFIVNGYFLPPVSFSSEEANALLLMESMVSGFTDKSILKHYSDALNKVKSVLKFSQKEQLEYLNENIKFQLPARMINDFEYLSKIQNAISFKQIITINYKNNKEESSCRKIEPIGLIFYAFSWHVIGWCHLRKDYRDFKVFRIEALSVLNEAFTISNHIQLNDYMKQIPVNF